MLSVKELKTDTIVQVIATGVPDIFKQSLAKIVSIDTRDGFYMVTLEFLNPPRIDELIGDEGVANGFSVVIPPEMVDVRDLSELFEIVELGKAEYDLMAMTAPSETRN